MENIGKVKIDYSLYSGSDSYSEGRIEGELLDIARNCSRLEYPRIIEEKASWPFLYHLSSIRENIVRWLPVNKKCRVLEVGSGCGEITGALCEMAGEVVALEESRMKSLICANRHSDCDNLTIRVGGLQELEKTLTEEYDYIFLIGTLEIASGLIESDNPYTDLISLFSKHLSSGGRMVIATENRLGLKYFNGCKEAVTGKWFKGIEGYEGSEGVKTFSKPALDKLLSQAGLTQRHYFYPYPDYRLMNTLFSETHLPKAGELTDNDRNFDNDRMVLFDEALAFDQMIEDGLFEEYANSFLVIAGPQVNVEYARFSNDRSNDYAIKTSIENNKGYKTVKKQALFLQGDKHILNMKEYEKALNERYEGGRIKINKCLIEKENDRPVAVFEFVAGKTLAQIMNDYIDKGDNEGFMAMFREYVDRIGYNDEALVSDKDIVFANIIVDGDDWTLIDYEWTVNKAIPTREIAFRSIYCYLMEHKTANKLNLDLILKELELSQEAAEDIRYDERRFQKQITGNRLAMGELRNLIGHKKFEPEKMAASYKDIESFYKFQVYRDRDGAFSEADSFFCEDAYSGQDKATVDIELSADEKIIRLDPLMDSCMVIIRECTYNGVRFPINDKKSLVVNGKRIDDNSFVFPLNDPNMIFVLERLPKQAMNKLHVEMDIIRISEEAAGKLASNIKKIF